MWQRAFRAFKYRNYRWFFAGQLTSLLGSWMQQIALAWLVYQLTGSALLLGTLATASMLPGLFIGPFAGVAADRWERRKILRWANAGFVVQALLVYTLFLAGMLTVPTLIALALALGVAQGFDWPVRQSLVMDLVDDREDIGNAIALNSTMWNLARLIGPLLGGILVGLDWIGLCFLLNALGSFWAWFSIGQLRTPERDRSGPRRHALLELREGIQYAASHPMIRIFMLVPVTASIFILPYTALLPIVASEWLDGGAKLYGILSAAPAIGAIFGGMYLASRSNVNGLPKIIHISGVSCGILLMLFSMSRIIPLTLLLLALLGLCFILQMSSANTLLQLAVEERIRGRVMSLYTALFTGAFPLGLIISGALSDVFGAHNVLFVGGVIGTLALFQLTRRIPGFAEYQQQ